MEKWAKGLRWAKIVNEQLAMFVRRDEPLPICIPSTP
jgi:hypothetical protein